MTTWGWRARSIAWWTIGVLVALAAAAFVLFSNYYVAGRSISEAVSTQHLKVGDCLHDWSNAPVLPAVVKKSRCDGPHYGEVFAILTLPDTQDYPGEEALKWFGDGCSHKMFDYAPDLPDGPTLKVAVGLPKQPAWANGDRSVVCVAMSKGERWSSLRG